jgi:uncharacterized protein YcfJ
MPPIWKQGEAMKTPTLKVFAVGFSLVLALSPAAVFASHTVCHNVEVQDQPKDQHQIAGMAIGAVGGGLLGHQVGGGKGKTLATVAGAVGGGYAGKKIQENQQAKHTHIERRCHRVED